MQLNLLLLAVIKLLIARGRNMYRQRRSLSCLIAKPMMQQEWQCENLQFFLFYNKTSFEGIKKSWNFRPLKKKKMNNYRNEPFIYLFNKYHVDGNEMKLKV